MNVVIVEDEILTAEKLETLLRRLRPEATVMAIIPSVKDGIDWFLSNEEPDLIFMDIQLGDERSFELFNHIKIQAPIIFTTAYDQYALQAFKQNSIDYLLKPIDPEDLAHALEQYDKTVTSSPQVSSELIAQLLENKGKSASYKERFLVKKRNSFESVPVKEIAFFKSEDKVNYLVTKNGQRNLIDTSLDKLIDQLSPSLFYRINRHMIIHINTIENIHTFFNGRLKLDLVINLKEEDIFVSRDRVNGFKAWLDS